MLNVLFEDFILQFDDCEEADVKHIEVALDLKAGPEAHAIMHYFKGACWSRAKNSCHNARTHSCVSSIKGTFWNKCLNVEGLQACTLKPSVNTPIQGIGKILRKHQGIADLILHNLDFFGSEMTKNFDGVFFTDHKNFSWHPALTLKQAFCSSQSALVRKMGTTRGFIHVHQMASVPRTKKSALTTAMWLREKCPTIPGIRYQRTLYNGAPYILSAVYPDASLYLNMPQTIKLISQITDPFPIKCTNSV